MQALGKIRVLDMTRILAGPYCTMLLADLGADVIKVEKPGYGDETRQWGPPFCGTESSYFLSVNRNKKSIAVDMKSAPGAKIVQDLASQSDVLVENYLPGKLGEVGLDYDTLKGVNPGIVYCSITGFGQTGPDAQRPGYDVMVSGIGGLMSITGPQDGGPCKVGVAITDLSTGLYAHGAILAALLNRQQTGVGEYIDCSLLSVQVASLVNVGSSYLNCGQEGRRHGTAHDNIVPYQGFESKDGHILVGALSNTQFLSLCKVLDIEHVSQDPRYVTNESRVINRQSLISILNDIFKTKPTSHWLTLLESSNIACGPVNNMQQVFSNPQVVHSGIVQEVKHSTAGRISVTGPPVKYRNMDVGVRLAPPVLGEHTDDVLERYLGYSQDCIKRLRIEGVIL